MMKKPGLNAQQCVCLVLAQVLSGSWNIGHVLVQYVLLGADAVILNVLGPIQLTHIKVKHLRKRARVYKSPLMQTKLHERGKKKNPVYLVYLAVLSAQLVHQHVHVFGIPLPVLTAEVLQKSDGFMQPIKDAHHPTHRHNSRLKVCSGV